MLSVGEEYNGPLKGSADPCLNYSLSKYSVGLNFKVCI